MVLRESRTATFNRYWEPRRLRGTLFKLFPLLLIDLSPSTEPGVAAVLPPGLLMSGGV